MENKEEAIVKYVEQIKEQVTQKNNKTKNIIFTISLLAILVFSIISSSTTAFAADCQKIREDVFRLHILANSDSKRDQELKLMVRDEILRLDKDLLGGASNKENAKNKLKENLSIIKNQATAVLRKNGSSYNVDVAILNMYFTTREYESFTLPAGMYDALRITIGKAEGKNWWCVLYPPLCIPAANSDKALDVLSSDEVDIIKGQKKYQFKFAIVELIEKVKAKLAS